MKNKDGSDLSFLAAEYYRPCLPFLVLAGLAVISFGNALGGFFLCDDLLHLGYLWRAFTLDGSLLLAPFYSPWLKDTSYYLFYRPLTELSLALDYSIYGTHAFGYHLTSLIWHIVNVWLLFILVKTLTTVPAFYIAGSRERNYIAFFTAAIWACYPTHSEAIGWISARSDLLATAFYFSALILFASQISGKRKISTFLVALPVVLGFLTKELTISLPFVLFALSLFTFRNNRLSWLKSLQTALLQTYPYFVILALYLIGRGLALGDFVGGYVGSLGAGLNTSLADRWLLSQSFFKIFHPFNDQIIPQDSVLRASIRLIWGVCGVMTLVCARVGGAIVAKYRLMLFVFVWLLCTLAPNLQIWHFSTTMAGGRIVYLPTAPIVLLIVLSVYPLGVQALSGQKALALKLAGLTTLSALIILGAIISQFNNRAWLEASNMVRSVRGQLNDLTDSLSDGQRLVLLNIPTHIKGAYAFTSPGMVEALLKPPLMPVDLSERVVILDAQPCSYPLVDFADIQATADHAHDKFFQLYYFDQALGKFKKAAQDEVLSSPKRSKLTGPSPICRMDVHDNEEGGENFRFKIEPPINPSDFEYVRVTLTLSAQAIASKPPAPANLCYVWSNSPQDEDGDKESFSMKLIDLPAPGQTARYLVRLGENKRWLLSKDVDSMQIFISDLKDAECQLALDFVSGDSIAPKFIGTVSGESTGDSLLRLKHLAGKGETLTLAFDASKIAGAKAVKIEMLPPYNYFDHYTRQISKPAFLPQHLRLIDKEGGLTGQITLKSTDFPKSAVYQVRAGAVDTNGEILGDFSEPITVTVSLEPRR